MSYEPKKPTAQIIGWPVDKSRVYSWAQTYIKKYQSVEDKRVGGQLAQAYLRKFVPAQFHGQIFNLASRVFAKQARRARLQKQEEVPK